MVITPHAHAAKQFFIALFLTVPLFGATGTIFYNSSTDSSAKTLRSVSADGSNDREISLAVPSPALPAVSRDGRALLVTSGGPLASVMLSQNVFRIELTTGAITPITHYVDTTSDGVTVVTNDSGNTEFDQYSYYTTHLPNHKAFSPSGDRVAVLDLPAVSGRQPGQIRLPAVQAPVLEVYPVQQAFPLGNFLITGAERTGVNQAGDGVDWHPSREELIGAFRADIPSSGNLGEGKTEGTVIFVFASSGASPLLRTLTTPTGRSYVDFIQFYTTHETEQDYAPAFSPDGTQVAYVRNTLYSDSRIGLGIWLKKTAIRVINYDGTGDRELASFTNNLWISKVVWSPDGAELAFDIAPRLVVNGLELQLGDLARSEIRITRVSDGATRLLVPAPAGYPSWSPLPSTSGQSPRIHLARAGGQFELELSDLEIGQQLDIETTTDLVHWTPSQSITASAPTQKLSLTNTLQSSVEFFRARLK